MVTDAEWSDVATNPGAATRSWKRQGRDSPLKPPEYGPT